MIRRLLWIALAALIAWVLRSALSSRKRAPSESPPRKIPRSGGHMVRDRVCNTFLPAGRAVSLDEGGRTHYFCSQRCRATYLENRRAAS